VIGEVEIILLNHALNAKRKQVIHGHGVKMMDIVKVIQHVRGVKQSFE
tara:strand:- start:11350 stop:11493 length:144 start_codon:yes stop_codon:yes gene_type:complete